MRLLLRYFLFLLLSFFLPLVTLLPNTATPDSLLDISIRLIALPIYGCLVVLLMTGFRPALMRRRLEQTPNRLDDLHLWLAPVLVILGFIWGGFTLAAILARAGLHETHPLLYLAVVLGALVFAVWMGVKVRRAFLFGNA